MALWSAWVWVAIAAIALVIIIVIVVVSRRTNSVEAPRDNAPVPGESPMEARRGIPDAEPADPTAGGPIPASPGRRMDEEDTEDGLPEDATLEAVSESLDKVDDEIVADVSLDEDTLHAPLSFPDEAAPAHAASAGEPGGDDVTEESRPGHAVDDAEVTTPEPPVEDFAADEPVDEPAAAEAVEADVERREIIGDAAAATEEEGIAEANALHDLSAPSPSTDVAAAVVVDEAELEETGSSPDQLGDVEDLAVQESEVVAEETTELGEDQGDIDDAAGSAAAEPDDTPRDEQGRRLDPYGNPVVETFEDAPQYADRGDYGDPFGDAAPDQDVPRDDRGRRLDPYGNPVDDGPDLPPVPPMRV